MPRFTLIKHPENKYDTEVTVTFECEMVDVAKAHYEDFLQGAGFSLPNDAPFERKLTQDDFLAREEDWMWDDAFASKFSLKEDVVSLDDYRKETFIPTFHD